MKFQINISIVILAATLVANCQGLFVKSAIKKSVVGALPSIVSSIGSLSTPLGGEIEAVSTTTDIEDAAPEVRFVQRINTIPVPVRASVYTYAPYYESPVYYRAIRPVARRTTYFRATSSGGIKGALSGLLAGSARTIGTIGSGIKGAIGNALSSSPPAGAEVYISSF